MHAARRYLALAATVALFVLGYWTLTAVFPTVLPASFLSPINTTAKDHDTPGFSVDPKLEDGTRIIPAPNGPDKILEKIEGAGKNKKFNMYYELVPQR